MSGALQTIESHDKSVAGLLTDFYVVPDYQREYVWQDDQIEQLLDDIHTEFTAASTASAAPSEYFIGSVVVCRAPDGRFDLIDGQQRMTTAYVLLCAIRDHLKARGAQPPDVLSSLLSASDVDAAGNDVFHHRVDLQYEDSGGVLAKIADGHAAAVLGADDTQSVRNLVNAYRISRAFLDREFGTDDQAVKRFFSYFTRSVKLIRITTPSIAHALKIFETINDRGVGLNAMDLLKNLMFMQVKPGEFGVLKERWKDLVDTLDRANEKPLRFLRYFIFAAYGVDRLKEEEIYDWFVRHESQVGYRAKPLAFVDGLLEAARAYERFAHAQAPTGAPNRYLANVRYLSGSARQHFILLLAARAVPQAVFVELCRHIENLLFTFVITRENTREFERKFAQWATELRDVTDEASLRAFLSKRFDREKRTLAKRFALTFGELDLSLLQKARGRYVVAKLTQYVDEQAYGSAGAYAKLDTYLNKDVHLEHILPQKLTPAVLKEFKGSESEARARIDRLGNLVLVEKPLNTSVGNRPFSAKRVEYPKSGFLLTRAVSSKVALGKNSAVNRAVEGLSPYETWTAAAIDGRQAQLRRLAHRVWDVPDPSGIAS
jgi:uncharacterized protein with ParB-like and HNH nuclease domain